MTSITQSIDCTFGNIASRIASLTPTLSEVTSRLLSHAYNDISDDLDALKAKVDRFSAQIDSVEHDNARQSLVEEAEARFATVIDLGLQCVKVI